MGLGDFFDPVVLDERAKAPKMHSIDMISMRLASEKEPEVGNPCITLKIDAKINQPKQIATIRHASPRVGTIFETVVNNVP